MGQVRKVEYEPEVCECCGMTKTYLLSVDRGTALIVMAIARKIQEKGVNAVHPRKEIEGKGLTSNQVGNLSRPTRHGLITHVKGERGNYLLTPKGAKFLRGEVIPRYAIVAKGSGKQIGYHQPEKYNVVISQVLKENEYWEGINYEIVEGNIIQPKLL